MKRHLSIALLLVVCASCCFPSALFSQEPVKNNALGIISVPLANVHDRARCRSPACNAGADGRRGAHSRKTGLPVPHPHPGPGQPRGLDPAGGRSTFPGTRGAHYLNPDRPWIVIAVPKAEALILDRTGDHKVPLYAGTRLPVLEKKTGQLQSAVPGPVGRDPRCGGRGSRCRSPDPLMNDTSAEDIAKTAKLFLGVRHLAGGITAQGMDTRGLYPYRLPHLWLSAHARTGARSRSRAERVGKKEIQPGDILFFNGESEGLVPGQRQVPPCRAEELRPVWRHLRQAVCRMHSSTACGSSAPTPARTRRLRR